MARLKSRLELSLYGKRFFQRMQVALRSGWACLFAGCVVQFGSPMNHWLAIPFFSLVICLNIIDSSIGAVLRTSVSVVVGMLEAMTAGTLLYLILGTDMSLVLTIFCVFVCSFCVAYPTRLVGQEMARKVSLALIGIIFTGAYNGMNDGSLLFLVRLMCTTMFGVFCALLAVCIPVPGLAFWEVRDSAKSTVKGASKLYRTLTEAFCAKEVSKMSSIFLHAKFLAKTAAISLEDHNNKLGDAYWELRGLNIIPSLKRMTEGLNVLKLHMMGMCMALQSGLILQYMPGTMVVILKDNLKRLVDRSKQMLDLTVRLKKSKSALILKESLLELAKKDLNSFDHTLKEAREKSYYIKLKDEDESLHKIITNANPEEQITAADKGVKNLFQSMVPTYFFLFNLRLYYTETMQMLDCGEVADPIQDIGNTSFHMPVLHHEVQDGLADTVQVVVTPVSEEEAREPLKNPMHRAEHVVPLGDEKDAGLAADPQHATFSRTLSNPITFKCMVCQRLKKEQAAAGPQEDIADAPLTWLVKQGWKRFKREQALRAFKVSLAMSLAALAGCMYNEAYAFWAMVSVAFIMQNQQGGSFRMANLRLQGTVLGSIYAYLMLNLMSKHPQLLLLALVPWVVLLSYLRFSKLFGASGVIAGLTAAIVMLGAEGGMSIQQLAVVRITQNFIGVLALILVETIIWPERAVILSRRELVLSLIDLRDCVKAVVAVYTGHHCPEHRKLVVLDIKKLEGQIRARIADQTILQSEVVMEPELWSHPFPAEIYSKLLHIQSRMHDLLHFMVCSLHAATEECLSEQIRKLVGPLQTSLVALEDEVLSSLHLLQELLQIGPNTLDVLSKASGCDDEERQLCRIPSRSDKSFKDLRKMLGRVHPLLVLECEERNIDGTPMSLKRTMDAFEASYEQVVSGFIANKKANPEASILSNAAMLSFSALTFSLQSLLGETVELEKAVHELLHFENPWSVLDFWESFPGADEECPICVNANAHAPHDHAPHE
ncbi:hypothetical protein MPTK2_6g90350P [Marchantia polymorpha subsp. ruderalis]